MAIIPSSRPLQDRAATEAILSVNRIWQDVAVVAVRGYFLDGMGEKGKNDRGIYDDALFIVSPASFTAFNANTDPSIRRKRIAVLKPGVSLYKPGIHGLSKPKAQQYSAFVQAGPVTVIRDGVGEETGWFGINIHRGGVNGTSSLGCQTLPPAQWTAFHALLNEQLKRFSQKVFPYVLVVDPRLGGAQQ